MEQMMSSRTTKRWKTQNQKKNNMKEIDFETEYPH